MENKFDLSIIKVALEHANFGDNFSIRDGLNDTIRALQLDLDDIGFEPSEHTKASIEALEGCISEVESPKHEKEARINLDDDVVEVREIVEIDEVEVVSKNVVNVDEELDEFDS